jgi:tetratricopeptide (TPR) repeat protein
MTQRSNRRRLSGKALLIAVLATLVRAAGHAQIAETFTNLKVLPGDTARSELMGVMRGFTSALGVRCEHCHVGDPAAGLREFDFASDEKETKRTARVMLRMVSEINGKLLPETGRESLIAVRCVTCHRGLARPESLEDVILAKIVDEGLDAGLTAYRELREAHYGGGAYDFSAVSLDDVTEALAKEKDDYEGAMAVNELNLEFNPTAAYTLTLHARLLLHAGDREGAIETLTRAIEANPEVDWLKRQLEEMQASPTP